jgi:hypothetical protein
MMVDNVTICIIAHICGTAVGEASTCWSDLDHAGVFDSVHANAVTNDLINKVMIELKRARVEAIKEYLELGPEECKLLLKVMQDNESI